MPKFRTKPVEIEALLWDGSDESSAEIEHWTVHKARAWAEWGSILRLSIETLEGTMHAAPGDYIIKGLRGEFYPCKPDVFHQKYEEVK